MLSLHLLSTLSLAFSLFSSTSATPLLNVNVDVDSVVTYDLVVSEGLYNPDGGKDRYACMALSSIRVVVSPSITDWYTS